MKWAPEIFKTINGLFCIYKPPDTNISAFARKIQKKLAFEFNELPYRPTRMRTEIVEDPNSHSPVVTSVPDIVDSPLVLGPRYQIRDFEMYAVDPLPPMASGVQVMGIGPEGLGLFGPLFEESMFMKVYRIGVMLGQATNDGTPHGHTTIRTTWRHVTQPKLDGLLASIEAGYQRQSYLRAGIHGQSETAFQLAAGGGLARPLPPTPVKLESEKDAQQLPPPVIYGLRCVTFRPPFLTLEMHSICDNPEFLIGLVEDMGVQLKSSALVTQIRRLRHGRLTADEHALLLKECSPVTLPDNIQTCTRLHPVESLGYQRQNFQSVEEPPNSTLPPPTPKPLLRSVRKESALPSSETTMSRDTV